MSHTSRNHRHRAVVLAFCLSAVMAIVPSPLVAQSSKLKNAQEGERKSDRDAIRMLSQRMQALFKKGDAEGIANLWTENGELINVDGQRLIGRKAIAKAMSETFKKNKERSCEVQIASIRFPSKNSAVEEGAVTTAFGKVEKPATTRYSILHVREDGVWRFALVREWEVITPTAKLEDVAWLVGNWAANSKGSHVRFSYKWSDNKAFIEGRFSVKEGKKRIISGAHIIGRDPAQDVLRSWVFMSDGSYGHGVWFRTGKRWHIETASTLADGRQASAVNILAPLSKNAFSWHSINRTAGSENLPDTAPIKVKRVAGK